MMGSELYSLTIDEKGSNARKEKPNKFMDKTVNATIHMKKAKKNELFFSKKKKYKFPFLFRLLIFCYFVKKRII